MLSLPDRASMQRALTLPLDATLHDLLVARIAGLVTADHDLTDLTHIIVIEPRDTETDIVREAGFSPLVNPIDGARFGTDAFQPWWDWLAQLDGWFEMIVTVGNGGFAYVLLIRDAPGRAADLIACCREFAA